MPETSGRQQSAPFLSIIVPVHDRERFVRRCLDSVLMEDMTGCEIVAIDDASSDGSVEVLQTYGNQIQLLRHSRNQGVVLARATGVTHANGEWAMFLDSDDELIRARSRVYARTCSRCLPASIVRCSGAAGTMGASRLIPCRFTIYWTMRPICDLRKSIPTTLNSSPAFGSEVLRKWGWRAVASKTCSGAISTRNTNPRCSPTSSDCITRMQTTS